MKTSKSLSRPFANAITCLLLSATASLTLISCQKEELANPQTATVNERTKNPAVKPSLLSNAETATVNDRTKKPTDKPLLSGKPQTAIVSERVINPIMLKFIFVSIKIDHYAANTSLPDYSITVNSNGIATYEGRKNVNIKGPRTFKVSLATLNTINYLCMKFFAISQPITASAIDGEAHPMVQTTYKGADGSNLILRDYNNGQPVWLVTFRNEVEKALDLSRLINIKGAIAEVNK